ncbi:MAG: hypothetical protein V7L23_31135 [Nostoc sp.]
MFLELSRHNQNILDLCRWGSLLPPNTQHLQPWCLVSVEIDPTQHRLRTWQA